MRTLASLALAAVFVVVTTAAPRTDTTMGIDRVTGDSILAHIRTLASDEFEGRAPGTIGEEKSVAYLTETCKRFGLAPGNPNGTYIQNVPLVGYTAAPKASFSSKGVTTDFSMPNEGLAISHRTTQAVAVHDSDVVFVGYAAVAPEYEWDDFKGVDVRGKTVVMLVGDPPVADPTDASKLDEKTFKGSAMTYYGRWTYKYEIASERGAAACIIVHETASAGYPYEVLKRGYGQEYFDVKSGDGNASRVAVEGWMTVDRARRLFADAGADYDTLKKAAARRGFKPVPLDAKASFDIDLRMRDVASRNVVARVDGADAKLASELVIYSAHWDHFGKNATGDGDQIFNGAIDDASGCAELLEIARAFASAPQRPKRTILFLFATAEEQGLLGSKYYAEHPLYPLARTVADINLDIMNVWGRTRSVVSISLGATTLDEILADVARQQGRRVVPDPEPEKGYFYRADHFPLVRAGIPALTFLYPGADYIGQPPDYGQKKRTEYVTHDYHKPSDEVRADWDMSGAVEDVRMLFEVGRQVADAASHPQWKPGAEFKGARDRSLLNATTEPWAEQPVGTSAGFRGLHALDANVVWASGTEGTWARSDDAGKTWTSGTIAGAETLDFRDVQAFGPRSAIVLSSGEDARIYRTDDSGTTWRLLWRRHGPGVFFDAMAFWDESHGIAIGDPVSGHFAVMTTSDGGATWLDVASVPPALSGEAAFAASGTCLTVRGTGDAWFATGGGSVARVFRTTDGGRNWTVAETPIRAGNASCGIFSIHFIDERRGVAVGGDYSKPDDRTAVAATTDDGGVTWRLVSGPSPDGYRSCVASADVRGRTALIAVGTSGSDVSYDGGRTWKRLGLLGFNSVSTADGFVWAAGPEGRIARLVESSVH